MIADKDNNTLIGLVSWYWKSKETNWMEIGVVIFNEDYWGFGIGYTALIKWIDILFKEKDHIERLRLTTWSGNGRMMKLAEKLDFKCEATYRIYSIKEVADRFQITRNKLRFYENKGLINPRRNESSGFREYSQKDLIDIQLILTYRALDVSIEDIKIVLSNSDDSQIEKQLFKQLKIVNALIGKYRTIQTGLEDTMNGYLKDLSAEDLRENFIKIGSEIIEANDKSDWVDLWDFDSVSMDYDIVVNSLDQPNFYNNYDKLLQDVFTVAINGLGEAGHVLGVGTGNLAGLFIAKGISIVGLDQSVNMMVKAKEKFPK